MSYIIKETEAGKRVRLYPHVKGSKIKGTRSLMEIESIRLKGRIEEKTDVYIRVKDYPEDIHYMIEEEEIYALLENEGIVGNKLQGRFEVVLQGKRVRLLYIGSPAYVKHHQQIKSQQIKAYLLQGHYYTLHLQEETVEQAMYVMDIHGLPLFRTADTRYHIVNADEQITQTTEKALKGLDVKKQYAEDIEKHLTYIQQVEEARNNGQGITRKEARAYQVQEQALSWLGQVYPEVYQAYRQARKSLRL